MKSLAAVAFFSMLFAAASARADERMLKISMVMSSADKVIASPTIIVVNGASGSIEIGEQGFPGALKTKAVLTPSLQDDGTVVVPVTLKLTAESVVDQKPQLSSREMTVQLKAHLGKKFALTVPTNDEKAPFSMSMQVDLLSDEAAASMRANTAK